jgi:hypothetical protein
MTPTFDPGDIDGVENASRLFAAFHAMAELTVGDGPQTARPAFTRLYAYVAESETDAEIEAALAADARLRADYRRLVEKHSAPLVPRALAADSGSESQREGIGCRLRFVPSSAEPSQTYVIIEFTESADAPAATLFLCDRHDNCRKVALDAVRDGRVQLLLDNNSDLLARLMDKDTEIRRGL